MTRYSELAAHYGTPLYVYDLERVEAAQRDLFAALPEEFELFYALKANPHPELVRAVRETAGKQCRAEISSTGELAVALEAGFTGADCLYTGPGKTKGEISEAIGLGVRMFSAESLGDLRHIGAVATEHGVVAHCLLRINSASASATTSIRMTGAPSQFGIDSETLPSVLPEMRQVDGVEIVGMHFFPLSNSKDEESLIGEFQHTIAVAAELEKSLGLELRFLDIGGGFAAPYATPGERPVYRNLRAQLESTLDEWFPRWRQGEPQLACESGRYIAGTAGSLLTGVSNVKNSRGRKFVILDAGINTFGGMSGLGRLLPVAVELDDDAIDGEREAASLVGPLCTPGDIVGRESKLPCFEEGDVVTIPNAGAYGPTASLLMFLGRPAPTEIVVRGDDVVSVSRLEHHRSHNVIKPQ